MPLAFFLSLSVPPRTSLLTRSSLLLTPVTSDMTLAPNIGSDRSWVWNVAADVSDGEPTQETLAIRFANAESGCCILSLSFTDRMLIPSSSLSPDAALFKAAFEKAQEDNKASGTSAAPDSFVSIPLLDSSPCPSADITLPPLLQTKSISDSAAVEATPKADDQAAAVEASKADPSPEPIAAPAAKSEGEFVATPAAVDAVKEQDKKADEGVDVKATE